MSHIKKQKYQSRDIFSRKKRSEIMSAIKSKNTKLERNVFEYLRRKRIRFIAHCRRLIGNPDIAIISEKKVIFIDSDFWHGWRYPKWSFSSTNEFWHKKISSNRKRDVFVTKKLRRMGWRVLRIWE